MGNNAVTRSAGATTHMCTDFFARLFQRERQGSKIIPQEKGGYTVGENGGNVSSCVSIFELTNNWKKPFLLWHFL